MLNNQRLLIKKYGLFMVISQQTWWKIPAKSGSSRLVKTITSKVRNAQRAPKIATSVKQLCIVYSNMNINIYIYEYDMIWLDDYPGIVLYPIVS